jgi:prevent-host-death family protein
MCYMRTVTHREMRNNSGEILRAVAAGESVRVTNNGQIAAVISPPAGDPLGELTARGQVRPARRPLVDLAAIHRRKPSSTSSELLADSRGRW